jgi:hypothetical protein
MIGFIGIEVYRFWTSGPWDLPAPGKGPSVYSGGSPAEEVKPVPPVGPETIVARNIFDPERGEGRSREVQDSSRAVQRVRSMVLLGTAILGNNRVAVLQDAPASRAAPGPSPQSGEIMRMKIGDSIEGFRLSEILDKKVVFTRGASRVEVGLDYFRKVEPPQPAAAPAPGAPPPAGVPQPPGQVGPQKPVVPRVVPNLPRRDKPAPPTPGAEPGG